jgi:hypothetical protein
MRDKNIYRQLERMTIVEERLKAFGDGKDVMQKFPVQIDEDWKICARKSFYFFAPARFSRENKSRELKLPCCIA